MAGKLKSTELGIYEKILGGKDGRQRGKMMKQQMKMDRRQKEKDDVRQYHQHRKIQHENTLLNLR